MPWRLKVIVHAGVAGEDVQRRKEWLKAEDPRWDMSESHGGAGLDLSRDAEGTLDDCLDALADVAQEMVRRWGPDGPEPEWSWHFSMGVTLDNHEYVPGNPTLAVGNSGSLRTGHATGLSAHPARTYLDLGKAIAFLEHVAASGELLFSDGSVD